LRDGKAQRDLPANSRSQEGLNLDYDLPRVFGAKAICRFLISKSNRSYDCVVLFNVFLWKAIAIRRVVNSKQPLTLVQKASKEFRIIFIAAGVSDGDMEVAIDYDHFDCIGVCDGLGE
jgi:hypothetical protein